MNDLSPPVRMPVLAMLDDVEEEVVIEDEKLAQAGFHPAWEKVEQEYMEKIEMAGNILNISPILSSEEYKVEALANAKFVIFLTDQLERVRNAVQAIERAKSK